MNLSSIRLVTDDVPALAEFYAQLTGLTPNGFADYMELPTQGATLAICSGRSVQAPEAGALASAANHSVVLEFQVPDVDAERTRLDPLVTDWVLEPTDQPWGNRSLLFRDPDGNLINLYTPRPHP